MARLARLCLPGWPHVVLQSGHNHQAVFQDDQDRQLFRDLLQQAAVAHGAAVHAYGLLDNEVRLLVTPSRSDTLSLLMQAVGRRYGAMYNRRHGRAGSLWEGRFRATVIEPERHLLTCMRYVEGLSNGVDPGSAMVPAWSSAGAHLGRNADPLIVDHAMYWTVGNTPFDREAAYKQMSQHALTPSQVSAITGAVRKGWPLGEPEFLNDLSALTGRRLQPLARGRPAKHSPL